MVITAPENSEFELQREPVRRFDRRRGHSGIDTATEELAFIEKIYG
jgi:hypothetical protein